jgi:hypothetical protein
MEDGVDAGSNEGDEKENDERKNEKHAKPLTRVKSVRVPPSQHD